MAKLYERITGLRKIKSSGTTIGVVFFLVLLFVVTLVLGGGAFYLRPVPRPKGEHEFWAKRGVPITRQGSGTERRQS